MNNQDTLEILLGYTNNEGFYDEAKIKTGKWSDRNLLISHFIKMSAMFPKSMINPETNLGIIIDTGYFYEFTKLTGSSDKGIVYMGCYKHTVIYSELAYSRKKSDIISQNTPVRDHIAIIVAGGRVKEVLVAESFKTVPIAVYDIDDDASGEDYLKIIAKIAKLKSENYISIK